MHSNRCQLHKNTVTAEPYSDLAIAIIQTKKIMDGSGRKMIMFCITVILIDRLHRIKQIYDKLKMGKFYLATAMLRSAKERLDLPSIQVVCAVCCKIALGGSIMHSFCITF